MWYFPHFVTLLQAENQGGRGHLWGQHAQKTQNRFKCANQIFFLNRTLALSCWQTPGSASSTRSVWATPLAPPRPSSVGPTLGSTVSAGSPNACLNLSSSKLKSGKCCLVYVEASDCCNELAFKLGQGAGTSGGTSVATRSWAIKVEGKNKNIHVQN